jgi:hypothetical protein
MRYKALRRDLTEHTRKCDFCPRLLTSLKAYVLEDLETGEIVYAGPKCAQDRIGADVKLSDFPDLTRFTESVNDGADHGGGGGGGGAAGADARRSAMEYLLLREQKLPDAMKCSFGPLREYFLQSQHRSLTDEEISHIRNIEAKAPASLRLNALQRCYNYLFWMDVGIARLDPEKAEFLQIIRAILLRKREITAGQRDGVNRWLRGIPGVPQLK